MENNFNLRKFLVENKLTVGSKQIKEGGYDYTEKIGDLYQAEIEDHLGITGKKYKGNEELFKKAADIYDDMYNADLMDSMDGNQVNKQVYDFITTNHPELLNTNEKVSEEAVTLSSKVDQSSITLGDVHTWDYPDFADAYIEYAEFNDGTPLSDEELNQLNDEMSDDINQLAHDSLYEGLSKKEKTLKEAVLKALR